MGSRSTKSSRPYESPVQNATDRRELAEPTRKHDPGERQQPQDDDFAPDSSMAGLPKQSEGSRLPRQVRLPARVVALVVHLQRVWIPVAAEWAQSRPRVDRAGAYPYFAIPWSTDSATPVPTTRVAWPRNVKMGFVSDGSDDRIGYMPRLDGLREIAVCCLWECARVTGPESSTGPVMPTYSPIGAFAFECANGAEPVTVTFTKGKAGWKTAVTPG
jgi:hypothetical protein